jgi:hypothetical protein
MQSMNKIQKQYKPKLYGYVKLANNLDESSWKVVKLLYARNFDMAVVLFEKYAVKKGFTKRHYDCSLPGVFFSNDDGNDLVMDWRA